MRRDFHLFSTSIITKTSLIHYTTSRSNIASTLFAQKGQSNSNLVNSKQQPGKAIILHTNSPKQQPFVRQQSSKATTFSQGNNQAKQQPFAS
jgi:hypothetical protein